MVLRSRIYKFYRPKAGGINFQLDSGEISEAEFNDVRWFSQHRYQHESDSEIPSRNTHQLRPYCTPSTLYTPLLQVPRGTCQMEFPPTCEIRVDNKQLHANLEGLKERPGKTPSNLGGLVGTRNASISSALTQHRSTASRSRANNDVTLSDPRESAGTKRIDTLWVSRWNFLPAMC